MCAICPPAFRTGTTQRRPIVAADETVVWPGLMLLLFTPSSTSTNSAERTPSALADRSQRRGREPEDVPVGEEVDLTEAGPNVAPRRPADMLGSLTEMDGDVVDTALLQRVAVFQVTWQVV